MARARGSTAAMVAVFESTYGTKPASGFQPYPFARNGLATRIALCTLVRLGLRVFGRWRRQFFGRRGDRDREGRQDIAFDGLGEVRCEGARERIDQHDVKQCHADQRGDARLAP